MATNEIYPEFTAEMKQTHTILIPNALPMHFSLMGEVFRKEGYHIDFLNYSGQKIIDTGLKYVHNDACYPAIIVIGSLFMHWNPEIMTLRKLLLCFIRQEVDVVLQIMYICFAKH